MHKGQQLAAHLQELKELYLRHGLTLDELTLYCARAGIDAAQRIMDEHIQKLQQQKGKI